MSRVLIFVLAVSIPALAAADLHKAATALDREKDPARLEAAAAAIAASGKSEPMARLARHLGERSFLRRLDPDEGSSAGVIRLGRIFQALAEHPSPAGESLCIELAGNAAFKAVPARLNFLLNALAAVRPMSEAAASVFRATSRSGYLEVNGPLLARNASPRALEVLAELFSDESLDPQQRVSMAHWAILPMRADPGVASMCARILGSGHISHEVEVAILESLFDYQPRRWFGVASRQPSPPSWQAAPAATRTVLASLGRASISRGDLPPELRAAIQKTLSGLQ